MAGVLTGGRHETQGECHVITKAEIGVTCLQARKYQRLSAGDWKLGKRRMDSPLQREHNSAKSLHFRLLASRIERQTLVF